MADSRFAGGLLFLLLTCVARGGDAQRGAGEPIVRVAIVQSAASATLGATGAFRVYASDGRTLLFRPSERDSWTFEPVGGRVRGSSLSGLALTARTGGVIVRGVDSTVMLLFLGKRYRGEIAILPNGRALLIVNRLGMENYLRGVVPLEIGRRTGSEIGAVKAQAVAARSYAHTRYRTSSARPFDLVGTVTNQVYGGVGAETALTDDAISDTRGVVLHHDGQPVDAPYSASCGGRTAAASELYGPSAGRPYLRSVSDLIPGRSVHYCDIYPRASWTRTLEARDINASLEKYLRDHVAGIRGPVGPARAIDELGRTRSGRVEGLRVRTDRGSHVVRGNAARFVVRPPNGEILPSTYFSAESVRSSSGDLVRVVLKGRGNGHGVGMCQWGAIGRARAGHSWESILQTYYPGTRLEKLY